MTAIVRIFTYAGLITARKAAGGGQLSTDSVTQLKLPYEGKDMVTVTSGSSDTSDAAIATSKTTIVQIQVQPGKTVHYEVTPENQDLVTVDSTSPYMSGDNLLQFGPGWRISFLEFNDA